MHFMLIFNASLNIFICLSYTCRSCVLDKKNYIIRGMLKSRLMLKKKIYITENNSYGLKRYIFLQSGHLNHIYE